MLPGKPYSPTNSMLKEAKMIQALAMMKLNSVEKQLGMSVDYLRHIVRTSLGAFLKFVKVMPLAEYRKALPAEPYHVARIVATRDADCGTCVQIEVNLAKKDRVSNEILRAVLDQKPEALSEQLSDVYHFAEAVLNSAEDEDRLREKVRKHYGEKGLVELALAIAICRVFPVTKRALGYATSCSQVQITL